MPIKVYRPTTSARRHTSVLVNKDLSKERPLKSLRMVRKEKSGRNNTGKISVRHKGGGARRYIRLVDFMQDKYDIVGRVDRLEYDPNRNANIALIVYPDGEKRYVLAPEGLKAGDKIVSSKTKAPIKNGNRLPLKKIPTGTVIFNVELTPGRGGQLARSAGNGLTLMALDNGLAQLRMPSGEMRQVSEDCMASIGMPGNAEYRNIRWGKAGRMRHRGIKPTVRGKAMNPVDHPHGGGEGKHPIGLKHPKTYTGKPALGIKTRRKNRFSDKFIIKRRKTREDNF